MVSPNTLDSKEEEKTDIPKRKGIENTVNNKPEESTSLTSEMSDHSLDEDIPGETVIMWMTVSVAISLLAIYTMIQWISGKLNKGIVTGKKTGTHSRKQHENRRETLTQGGGKEDANNSDRNLQMPEEKRDEDIDEEEEVDESNDDDLLKNQVTSDDSSVNVEKNDDMNIIDTLKNANEERGTLFKSTSSNERNDHEMPINVGRRFSGSLSITTATSTPNTKFSCTETCTFASNDKDSNTTGENGTNRRSAATLQNNNHKYTTPVTVNYLQTKCLSCNPDDPQLSSTQPKTTSPDSPGIHPPCTLHCVQTALKSVSVEDKLNARKTVHNDYPACATESKDLAASTAARKSASDSLNFLASYHTPQDGTDGSILPKNTSDDEFVFPQDNATATEDQAINCFKEVEEVKQETARSRYLKYIREDPELSKSLDSQMEILKKGRKLLEKKPLKSSLRSAGSDENMVRIKKAVQGVSKKKKFVHFPPDIRHIRTVHKYHSFDEALYGVTG